MANLLDGMTIVEGASFIAGPSCTLHLAQLGARVIRFDQIGGGPDHQRWPLAPSGNSLYWEGLNREKLLVGLDLRRPEGRRLAQRLAVAGDELFVTNYPADGFLSWPVLSACRGDLICARVMGWASGAPAIDYTVNAAIGLPMMTGPEGFEGAVNHVLPAWDIATGAYAAFSLLAAERARARDGEGRELRIALSDVAAASVSNMGMLAEPLLGEGERVRAGNAIYGSFGRDFMTIDGVRLMIAGLTSRQWQGLVDALDIQPAISALEGELGRSFAMDEGARYRCRERLFPIVERQIAAQTLAELAPALDREGVCWSVYQPLRALGTAPDPRFAADGLFSVSSQPSGASYPLASAPVRLSNTPRRIPQPAHRLGDDTQAVLGDLLGIGAREFADLRDRELVA